MTAVTGSLSLTSAFFPTQAATAFSKFSNPPFRRPRTPTVSSMFPRATQAMTPQSSMTCISGITARLTAQLRLLPTAASHSTPPAANGRMRIQQLQEPSTAQRAKHSPVPRLPTQAKLLQAGMIHQSATQLPKTASTAPQVPRNIPRMKTSTSPLSGLTR